MKKILFGISLILFGFFITYISISTGGDNSWLDILGMAISVIGLIFAVKGYLSNEK